MISRPSSRPNPPLKPFVAPNAYGDDSIDYADPAAVKALNQALLKHAYSLQHWGHPRRLPLPAHPRPQ